jgi:hypothetical protein
MLPVMSVIWIVLLERKAPTLISIIKVGVIPAESSLIDIHNEKNLTLTSTSPIITTTMKSSELVNCDAFSIHLRDATCAHIAHKNERTNKTKTIIKKKKTAPGFEPTTLRNTKPQRAQVT